MTWDNSLEKVSRVFGCLEATEEEEMLQPREIGRNTKTPDDVFNYKGKAKLD